MAVPTNITDLSATIASNAPSGSETIGTNLDDYMRAVQGIIKQNVTKGSDIASSTTITIPAAGNYFVVTGTTTITTIANTNAWTGREIVLKFSGALTLTHSSGLILPTAANITTEAGDIMRVVYESASVWRCTAFVTTDGKPLVQVDTAEIADDAITADKIADNAITNAMMQDNSVDTLELVADAVTAAKIDENTLQVAGLMPTAWCVFDGTAASPITIDAGYNVTNVTTSATGKYTVNVTTNFDNTNYIVLVMAGTSLTTPMSLYSNTKAVGSFDVYTVNESGTFIDADEVSVLVFGGRA